MLSEHKQPAIWCISLGFGLQLIGAFLQSSASYRLAPFLLCASAGLLYFGCSELAEGKGWSSAWGWLGVLGLPGVIIVLCLKDHFRNVH